MNMVDCYVTQVLDVPHYDKEWDLWKLPVEYVSWGVTSVKALYFKTEEEAKSIKEGYKFQS
jgi:hypothetical protein